MEKSTSLAAKKDFNFLLNMDHILHQTAIKMEMKF